MKDFSRYWKNNSFTSIAHITTLVLPYHISLERGSVFDTIL